MYLCIVLNYYYEIRNAWHNLFFNDVVWLFAAKRQD